MLRARRWWWIVGVAVLCVGLGLTGCGGGGAGGGGDDDDDGDDDGGGGGGGGAGGTLNGVVVLATNDLGMHCMDREYGVFSILPPYNVVHAQVVRRTAAGPRLLTSADVTVDYDATADGNGSRNSKSVGKTDFWTHASALFGVALSPGQGLKGLYMPGDAPVKGPQAFTFAANPGWWAAEGIPITPRDDGGRDNTYPLMRVTARDRFAGTALAHLDVVVPVAQETDCSACHRTGGSAASGAGATWSAAADLEVQSKENVLRLHDARRGTNLFGSQPVLCATCHYSPALDLAGAGPQGAQRSLPWFSRAIHRRHDFLPSDAQSGCYQCHPGAVTQCARGPMVTSGLQCRDCHGGMAAVAGETPLATGGSLEGAADGAARRAWTDLPRCQSCHTGDAVTRLTGGGTVLAADGIRLRQAWRTGDAAASPIKASTSRFAENANQLYRASTGHGGVFCQGCHGSTHAEWPTGAAYPNDNVAATALQGHTGTIRACATCHAAGTLPLTTGGPHGMHNVGDSRWANGGHGDFYERNPSSCAACHGTPTGQGTVLATAAADRPYGNIRAGQRITCTRCHGWPADD